MIASVIFFLEVVFGERNKEGRETDGGGEARQRTERWRQDKKKDRRSGEREESERRKIATAKMSKYV